MWHVDYSIAQLDNGLNKRLGVYLTWQSGRWKRGPMGWWVRVALLTRWRPLLCPVGRKGRNRRKIVHRNIDHRTDILVYTLFANRFNRTLAILIHGNFTHGLIQPSFKDGNWYRGDISDVGNSVPWWVPQVDAWYVRTCRLCVPVLLLLQVLLLIIIQQQQQRRRQKRDMAMRPRRENQNQLLKHYTH